MKSIAENVSLQISITLDWIQYNGYEIICSSSLLNLLNEISNKNSNLVFNFATNKEELNGNPTNNIKAKLIELFKTIGAKDQLVMFATGPAGAEKSSAIAVV